MNKILIIEDDMAIVQGLKDTFQFHGFDVVAANTAGSGWELYRTEKPDLIILDIMLPDHDGYEICKKIREKDHHIPIIMLTAKSQENDKLLGFELGADDYVTKPFSLKELVARVKVFLKRRPGNDCPDETVKIGRCMFNARNFQLVKGDQTFPLSPKECEILKFLVQNPDQVIDRGKMIDEVWGDEYFPSPKTIDNFILKLRNKIEEDPRNPQHILTIHGAGYRFKF